MFTEWLIATIDYSYRRDLALCELGVALAQAQEWAEAERVIATIENSSYRVKALSALGASLMNANKHLQLLRLVQRSWQHADIRGYAVAILSLANDLIPLKPEIGNVLCKSFSWVDDFLKGYEHLIVAILFNIFRVIASIPHSNSHPIKPLTAKNATVILDLFMGKYVVI